MKQDEFFDSKVKRKAMFKPTLKRWSNRDPTVEPRCTRQKTDHQAPASLTQNVMPEPTL